MPRKSRGWAALAIVVVALISVAACTSTASVAGSPSVVAVATTEAPLATASSEPTSTALATEPVSKQPPPTGDGVDGPPAALLAAEGGDPVTGQLGTYVWAGGGSDSPWLRGAPITVGANEPLDVTFRPPIDVVGWRVRFVPSKATDPTGARSLGEGADAPRFEAPEAGSWTVEVHVDFADGTGSASYFWLVTAH